MNGFIGYQPEKIQELMQDIANSYEKVGETISHGWPNIPKVMQNNWKGVDEQAYEKTIADRINTLYDKTTELVTNMIQTIVKLANAWQEFQNNNRIDTSVATANYDFTAPAINLFDMKSVVKLNENTFAGEKLGIVTGGGALIETALTEYKTEIETGIKNIYSEYESCQAFFGNQTASIDQFIEAVGEAIKRLNTDIDDLMEYVDQHTDTGYSEADTTVSGEMGQAATNIGSGVSNH